MGVEYTSELDRSEVEIHKIQDKNIEMAKPLPVQENITGGEQISNIDLAETREEHGRVVTADGAGDVNIKQSLEVGHSSIQSQKVFRSTMILSIIDIIIHYACVYLSHKGTQQIPQHFIHNSTRLSHTY